MPIEPYIVYFDCFTLLRFLFFLVCFAEMEVLPVVTAVVIATLQIGTSVRMSGFRSKQAKDPDAADEVAKSDAFMVASRVQINHAEYSGALIALLVYIQLRVDAKDNIPWYAVMSTLLVLAGCVFFVVGYSLVENVHKTNPLRVAGALMRYCGFTALAITAIAMAKK